MNGSPTVFVLASPIGFDVDARSHGWQRISNDWRYLLPDSRIAKRISTVEQLRGINGAGCEFCIGFLGTLENDRIFAMEHEAISVATARGMTVGERFGYNNTHDN